MPQVCIVYALRVQNADRDRQYDAFLIIHILLATTAHRVLKNLGSSPIFGNIIGDIRFDQCMSMYHGFIVPAQPWTSRSCPMASVDDLQSCSG